MPRKADEILHFRQTQNNPKTCPVEGGAVKPLVRGAVLRDSRGIKHLYVDYTVHIYVVCVYIYILVGGAITILENMKASRKDDIPYIMENKKCSKPPTSIYIYTYQWRCPKSWWYPKLAGWFISWKSYGKNG